MPFEGLEGVLHLADAKARTTVVACSPVQDAGALRLGELLEGSALGERRADLVEMVRPAR